VVFAPTHVETADGAHIDAGEVPVATAGVYSPTDLRNALGALGFDSEQTERALDHELQGDTATRAVAIAERRAGNAEVLA
jgi:SOS response regulatory protein OraA/RecX